MQDPPTTTSPPTPSTSSIAAVHPETFEGPAASPNLHGRSWKPGNVSLMVHGALLANMIPSATIGFAAHVVSAGSPYKDLEGPVFGTRVGIYSLGALDHRIQGTGNVTDPDLEDAPFRVVLYRLHHGIVESSNADDHPTADQSMVTTVPHCLKQPLLLASEPTAVQRMGSRVRKQEPVHAFPALSAPMPSIPEMDVDSSAVERAGDTARSDNDAVLDRLDARAAQEQGAALNEMEDHLLPWEQDRNEEDRDATPLGDEEEVETPSPDFWPTKAQLVDLKIAHDNNGHPTATDFARMIRLGNGKPELVKWVKHHFRCDDCEAHRKPKARRPSAVPRSYRFNHVVGIDLLTTKDPDGVACFFLNVICWGTSLQQVKIVCGDNAKTAENVWNTFVDTWVRVYGLPDILVLDPGLEFEGYFSEQAQAYGITVLPTDRESPWQNGRTERAGGLWKQQLKIASRKTTPVNRTEWLTLGSLCVQSRNRYHNRSSFTPLQRVFCENPRLPDSLLSDDAIDPALLCENPSTDYQRAAEMRVAATRAWAALDSRTRMQRSLRARHRTTHNFVEGQLVFVWRQPRVGPGKWIGPGLIVIPTAEELTAPPLHQEHQWAPSTRLQVSPSRLINFSVQAPPAKITTLTRAICRLKILREMRIRSSWEKEPQCLKRKNPLPTSR